MSFYSQFLQFFIDHNAAQCIAYPVLPAVYNSSHQSSFQHVSSWYRKLRHENLIPHQNKASTRSRGYNSDGHNSITSTTEKWRQQTITLTATTTVATKMMVIIMRPSLSTLWHHCHGLWVSLLWPSVFVALIV